MKRPITKRMKNQAAWYSKKYSKGDSWRYDDLLQECYLSFCESELKFDETKGLQFEGFAVNCMRNHLVNYLKTQHVKFNHNVEIISEYNVEDNGDVSISGNKEVDFTLFFKDKTLCDIMDAKFNYGLSIKELMEHFDLSKSKIEMIIENALSDANLAKYLGGAND